MSKRTAVGIGMLAAIAGLFCCLPAIGKDGKAALGKIEAGKPRYVSKNHEAWNTKGRIVGIAKEAPDFQVTILNASKKKVKTASTEKLKDGGRAYEVWLEPGSYILVIKADAFATLDVHDLKVKRKHDLRVDLEFTKGN